MQKNIDVRRQSWMKHADRMAVEIIPKGIVLFIPKGQNLMISHELEENTIN
jgi:hypothetical protein